MLTDAKLMAFVPTGDPARARSFYVEKLGFRFLAEDPFAVTVEAAGTKVRLVKIQAHVPTKFTILGWEVADIQGSVAEMRRRGIPFQNYGLPGEDGNGIWTTPDGHKIAWFCDPDKNVLSLTQWA